MPPVRATALIAVAALVGGIARGLHAARRRRRQRGGREGKIALLLPDAKTARYETFDRPLFEDRVAELGRLPGAVRERRQDAAKQQQQAESALAAGADVLVLDPVDAQRRGDDRAAANAQGVPVISYDRLIAGGDLAYYISFDNEKVGELQATAFVRRARGARAPAPPAS